MNLKTSLVKGGFHLSLGQAAAQVSSFVRNIILARLISPGDFGIAAVFGIVLQMVEMLSNIAAETLLIQAEDGDEERLQATVQFIRVVRGAGNSLIILVLAGPFAKLFGVPQATWAFRCLALLPVLRSLGHLDVNRFQRTLRFGPSVIVDAGSTWAATIIAIPLAFWLRDYSAMLWALLIQVAAATLTSHFLAERHYSWIWDRSYWKRITSFGWPLLVNGILMFGIFEGDRLVIGSSQRLFSQSVYTLTDLGVYSVAFSLTMAPALFIANISSSLFLPLFSRVQKSSDQFRQRYLACSQSTCLAAAVISIFFITAGGKLVSILYGSKYAAASTVVGWLTVMWALRIIRVAPTLAAVAMGDTKNMMFSNSSRSLALVGMAVAAGTGSGLVWIAISGFCGELLALVTSVWRLYRKNEIPPSLCAKPIMIAAGGVAISSFFAWEARTGWAMTIGSWLGCTILVSVAMLAAFPDFYADIRSSLFKPRPAAVVEA